MTPPACGHPLSEGEEVAGQARDEAHDAQGLKPLVNVNVGPPLRGFDIRAIVLTCLRRAGVDTAFLCSVTPTGF